MTPNAPERRTARFEYIPALDGVRAVALLAVMAYHGGLGADVTGGLFSLDAFFALSGFLITSLLVTEWRRSGTIALRAFWARRARRLFPAALVTLLGVALYARFAMAKGMYPDLRIDSLSTMFYVANWHFILAGSNYFVQTGPPSPLLHTWSLAVEEQFYLVWPILVLVALRWWRSLRAMAVLAALAAAGSAIEMGLLYSPANATRVYFGSDTHAQSLLIGAVFAFLLAAARERPPRAEKVGRARSAWTAAPGVQLVGLAGAATTAYLWTQVPATAGFAFRGGVTLASAAVVAVIASVVAAPGGVLARVLAFAPLRYIGRISYGMYLFHFPVDLWVTPRGVTGWPLFLLRTAITVAFGTVSYYLIERPIRQGGFFRAVRAWSLAPPAVVLGAAVIVLGTPVPASSVVVVHRGGIPAMIVGDSVGLTIGFGLEEREGAYDLGIVDKAQLGCGVAIGPEVRLGGSDVATDSTESGAFCSSDPPPGYVQWPTALQQWLTRYRPDVVVLVAGRWEVVDRVYDGRWTNILDPTFAAYVKQQLELAVSVGTSSGAKMVLETAPCYDSGLQPDGSPWPEDSPKRLATYNALVRQVAAEHPGSVALQDLDAIACPGGRFTLSMAGVQIRGTDGVHFTFQSEPNGGTVLAPALLPLWEQLGREVETARIAHG